MTILSDAITETQEVRFILDADEDFALFEKAGLSAYRRAVVVADSGIEPLFLERVVSQISDQVPVAATRVIPAVEDSKDISHVVTLVQWLTEIKTTRADVIIAIGGGVILDIVSFVASVFMRGIPLVMIPTTLIGQADASTAGKTCVNVGSDKNIVGSLYLPKTVYSNVTLLRTTSAHSWRQGFSEIVKYGFLGSAQLLELVRSYRASAHEKSLIAILEETIRVRMTLRKRHPLVSNFGHTFGHAIEKYTHFAVAHGDAISVGMVMALEFSAQKGIVTPETKSRLIDILKNEGLNTLVEPGMSAEKLTEYMLTDKKSSGNRIGLVLIEDIAKPLQVDGHFYEVNPEEMVVFCEWFLNNPHYTRPGRWKELLA
jgi:3-dehydroquinate synthetase